MIKYIKVSAVSIVMLFSMFIGVTEAFAWDDCPFGKVDDPYPGDCARYVDTDNDGICDHSQPAPEDRVDAATVEVEEDVPATEDVVDDTSVNINTISNTNSIVSTNSINTDTGVAGHNNIEDDTEEVPAITTEEEKDKSKLINGLIAIFLPLIVILGYVIWQKKKLK